MNIIKRTIITTLDGDAAVKDALKLLSRRIEQPARRAFLQRTLTLGGVAMLSGCNLTDGNSVDAALESISRLNDRAQGVLFDPTRLAPTYPDSMVARPFRFNAYYGEDEIRVVDGDTWRLEVTGLVADKRQWTLDDRGLECHRQMGWRALRRFPEARRRRPDGEVRGLQVLGRLLHQHRHGHGAAPADEPVAHL